ncbi:hypothetical protein KSP40_PGU005547 [Platanthera guangdongensis]|uniref:Uncharacterized protein n=1 Tax=Platanthera guangdongensis TaxID=2320717 RepID=A0ABR2N1M9_9ASPA
MSAARVVLSAFEDPPVPDFHLRNGDASDSRSLLVRPSLPAGYRWVPVAGVAPEDALVVVEAYIMSALYQLENNPPAETTKAGRRKMAIVLGTSRAVMTGYYRLTYTDFIGDELAAVVINARPAANGKFTYRLAATVRADLRDLMIRGLAPTKEEEAVMATLLPSSLGVLPVQGYSLIMTGHHYLGERNSHSRRAFAAIERQFWNHNAVKNWFAEDMAMIQDCAWHKSGHPVIPSIKESMARDERIAAMLRVAGVGSAASRLPAMETQLRTATSYLALMSAVDPLLKMFGGSADATELSEMVGIIKSWPPTTTGSVGLPETWPQSVETRAQALSLLGKILAKNAAKVAYCYGFYCAFGEQNQALSAGDAAADILRTSYSLVKLKSQSLSHILRGCRRIATAMLQEIRRSWKGRTMVM